MRFTEGAKVITIEDNKIKKGVIKSLYDTMSIAIVKFEDGSVGKIEISKLALDQDEKKHEEPEKPTESVEKSEITITPEEFRNIAVGVVVKETKDNVIVGLVLTRLIAKLHKALFFDNEGEND
jgi:hypothetical protein